MHTFDFLSRHLSQALPTLLRMPLLSLESDRLDIRGHDDEDMARELGMAPIKVTSLTVPLCIPMLGGI